MRLKTANIILSPVTATQRITAKPPVPIARILYPVGHRRAEVEVRKAFQLCLQNHDRFLDSCMSSF